MIKCNKCGSKNCSSTQREGEILCHRCKMKRDSPVDTNNPPIDTDSVDGGKE